MNAPSIAIVGATGAVGVEILRVLERRNFPVGSLRLLASARSAGKTLDFRGKPYPVAELTADAFAGVAVTANGSGASGQWQYFDGLSWVDIGPASDGAAVLLAASTSVRFNPAPGFFGAAP